MSSPAQPTVTRLRTPLEPLPLGTFVPPPTQLEREAVIAEWLNIDRELVYQPTFGGHPIILPYGNDVSRRDIFPDLDAGAAWWPLLWATIDQSDRYDEETDDEYAYRILIDTEMRGMYDSNDGTWLPVWSVWQATSSRDLDETAAADQWEDRVDRWLDGEPDDVLDDLEPGPLPDGYGPDSPYEYAQLRIDDVHATAAQKAVQWVIATVDADPRTVDVGEMWDNLCAVADALTTYSTRWQQWFDIEIGQLQPVADAAIATGVRDSFDRQASRIVTQIRRELAKPNPL